MRSEAAQWAPDMNTFVLLVHSHLTQIPLRLPEKKIIQKKTASEKMKIKESEHMR